MPVAFILLAITTISLASISVGVHYGAPVEWYSSWPMLLLWGATAVTALWRVVRYRATALGVHIALAIILAGAFVTWIGGDESNIKLRQGQPDTSLPFKLTADSVAVEMYPGTQAPMDYRAVITADTDRMIVSMNHVGSHEGYRFFLKSIDPAQNTVTLNVQHDTAGIIVSYIGYALLGVTMLLFFFNPRSAWRASLRKLSLAVMLATCAVANASEGEQRFQDWFMRLNIYHNDKVSPMTTFCADFAVQLTGSQADATEMVYGLLFHFSDWKQKPIIRIKSEEVRSALATDNKMVSYVDFFDAVTSGRIDIDHPDRLGRAAREDIARFEAVNMLVSGSLLKLFPISTPKDGIVWLAPTDRPPVETDNDTWAFIRKSMGYMNELVQTRRYGDAADLVDKICRYQVNTVGEADFPSEKRLRAERYYVRWLRPSLGWAIATVVIALLLLIAGQRDKERWRVATRIAYIILPLPILIYLTLCLALRWYVSGHVPLSDGFETMQFMAWLAAAGAFAAGVAKGSLWRLLSASSLLVSGLCLLVSAMNGGGASMTPLMPVLASPWLSIHVALMMLAYTLFAVMAVIGVCGLCGKHEGEERPAALCHVLLVPAIFLLAAGIFTGAVWANQSWGRYWGWDPKEVWALITMIVYCYPVHGRSIGQFRNPRTMMLYVAIAFVTVLFTYFGVNYLLGGLHSYA